MEKSGKKIVLVGGCFDLLHYGHLVFLEKAKGRGDYLVVLLESDEFITKNKRRHAVHTQEQRAKILSSIKYVDKVIRLPLFTTDRQYEELIKKIKPSIIAVSRGDRLLKKKKKQAESVGGKLYVVSDIIGDFSTSKIIKDLSEEL